MYKSLVFVLVLIAMARIVHTRQYEVEFSHIDGVEGTLEYDRAVVERLAFARKNEVVVDLVDGISTEEIGDLEKSVGGKFYAIDKASFEPQRLMILRTNLTEQSGLTDLIQTLRHDRRVELAERNFVYSIPLSEAFPIRVVPAASSAGEPNDPLFKYQWHMKMIHVPEAWASSQGEGVTVAVIDTGVTHSGNVVEDMRDVQYVDPFNFVNNTPNANDDHGHGTHVAATIAETANNGLGCVGVAPKAKIMPLKVLSKHGSGTIADIAASIIYAADKGAKVINMSLGGPYPSAVLEKAVDYAYSKGVIVVCAAGNSGPSEGTVGYPAGCKHAVAVSSVDSLGTLAWYSSWGKEVAIAAPGGDTRADKNGDGKPDGVLQNTIVPSDPANMARYELFQGTSMASPHVAGVAALVASKGIRSPSDILKVMQTSATKKDNQKKYGAGIVDALASVRAAEAWLSLQSLQDVTHIINNQR